MKITAAELKLAILEYFRFGKQCIAVDEYNGADVIADTGKEIVEIEVKVDRSDLRHGEHKKQRKHACYKHGNGFGRCHPNKFFFCVPTPMIELAREVVQDLNPKYGIIAFDVDQYERTIKSGYVPYTMKCLHTDKRAGKLHTGYPKRQQRLIAKRCSAKLITLLQHQHSDKVKRSMENG